MAKGRIIDFEGAIVTLFRPEVRAHNLLYRCPASDWPSPDLPFYDDRLECVLGATGRRPCTTVGPHPNGSTANLVDFLRTDPQFYCDTPQELLDTYRALSKRIDPELVKVFRTLPRGIRPSRGKVDDLRHLVPIVADQIHNLNAGAFHVVHQRIHS